jgi:hypothetical protein
MKKVLIITGSLLVILIMVAVCLVLFWLGPVVEKTIERIAPKAAGVAVDIEKLYIYPLRGIVELNGLFVGNPEGFANESAVELKSFRINLDLSSLFTDTIIVREILIESPVFTYERQLKTDNIKEIQKNVAAYAAEREQEAEADKAKDPAEADKAKDPAEAGESGEELPAKKVIIEKLLVRDGKIKAKISALPTTPIPLRDIEKTDIGKEKGGTSWSNAGKEVISVIYDAILGAVSNVGSMAGDALKSTGDAAVGAGESVIETTADAVKSFGGLFKKDE